ncbi:MAG: hypothetical protein C4K60_19715 [Ideonella sp. MAG2]|nr:MAG: hypothetical protein C4K60_19715 [Ideonella sp. MAG2]
MTSKYALERSRRSFLKTSAASLALVAAGGWVASHFADQGAKALYPEARILGAQAQTLLARLADAILDGMLPTELQARQAEIVRVVATAEASLQALPPHIQKETQDLLVMLGVAPTRALLIGQWTGWAQASREQVNETLQALRTSSVGLRRAVYMGLRDLVASCYYASPTTWAQIGYPGPLLRGPGVEV